VHDYPSHTVKRTIWSLQWYTSLTNYSHMSGSSYELSKFVSINKVTKYVGKGGGSTKGRPAHHVRRIAVTNDNHMIRSGHNSFKAYNL